MVGPFKREGRRDSSDDLSNRTERILIGVIGLMLPLLLVIITAWRPQVATDRWRLLDSISEYYYSGAVAAFVGLLVTLALFLFSYQGYENSWHKLDIRTARLAASAAVGVAFFPTAAQDPYTAPPWWMSWMKYVHYTSAAALFLSFAFFALFLFRRTDPRAGRLSRDKRVRDAIYLACGIIILAAIAWTALNGLANRPIFAPESVALVFFAISWLVKGRAFEALWRTVSSPTPAITQ
jgi:hypothetical protein